MKNCKRCGGSGLSPINPLVGCGVCKADEDVKGYKYCDCRDCFNIVIDDAYCDECRDECGPENSTSTECRAVNAYGDDEEEEESC